MNHFKLKTNKGEASTSGHLSAKENFSTCAKEKNLDLVDRERFDHAIQVILGHNSSTCAKENILDFVDRERIRPP